MHKALRFRGVSGYMFVRKTDVKIIVVITDGGRCCSKSKCLVPAGGVLYNCQCT